MAWFIGQSAVMIVLAFLLGLLVGWLIWGRRVRALYLEVIALREAAATCEANHGGSKATDTKPVRADSSPATSMSAASVPAESAAADSPTADSATADSATAHIAAVEDAAAHSATAGGATAHSAAADGSPVASTQAAGMPAGNAAVGRAPVRDAAADSATADNSATGSAAAHSATADDAAAHSAAADGSPVASTQAAGMLAEDAAVGRAPVRSVTPASATPASAPPASAAADNPPAEGAAAAKLAGNRAVSPNMAATRMATVPSSPNGSGPMDHKAIEPEDNESKDAERETEADDVDADDDAVLMTRSVGVTDDATAAAVHIPAPRAEMAEVAVSEGPADELARIEGIGPKIASALIAANIRTFAQLADADEETLTAAVKNGGISFAPSLSTWSQQARLLADGDEEGFLELTERLVAGRVVAAPTTTEDADPIQPPDDLARIEGIGPKIASALIAANIRTYAQLADADTDTLTKAIKAAGIKFAPSLVTWSQQARLLADGEEDRFAELTARLIAGRRPDDDLERIEGIGPKMAAALHATGIRTYRALADSSDVRLRNAITGSGLSFAPSIVTWARQARLLADGDEEGFAELTRRLVAGRDEGRA